jgi:hypothetical protein
MASSVSRGQSFAPFFGSEDLGIADLVWVLIHNLLLEGGEEHILE